MSDQTANPVRGTVPIEIDGVTYIMRLTWHGVAQIRTLYPEGYDLMDMKTLATIMAICLPDNKDITADWVMDRAPPIEPSIEKVSDMINYAWFGTKEPPEAPTPEEKENPPKKTARKV